MLKKRHYLYMATALLLVFKLLMFPGADGGPGGKELPGNNQYEISFIDGDDEQLFKGVTGTNGTGNSMTGYSVLSDISPRDRGNHIAIKLSEVNTEIGITPFTGYGILFPISAYGKRYRSSGFYTAGVLLDSCMYMGFVPEFLSTYGRLESRKSEGEGKSSLSLLQGSLGFRYSLSLKLSSFTNGPGFLNSPVTIFVRVTEGVTRVTFESNQLVSPMVEYIATFGLSAGFKFTVIRYIDIGMDFGYRHIAAKEVPIQTFSIMFLLGLRM